LTDKVDSGEASAIALAHEIEFRYLITDEYAARALCSKLAIAYIGTIGVLLRAKEHGLIPEMRSVLERIKQTNFRLSEELYLTALRKAGEE